MKTIGLISDTHGLMRPEALEALEGVELILHAGDVGSPDVLDALERVGPVWAVRGNTDRDAWADRLPATQIVEAAGSSLYVLHDLAQLDLDPGAAGFAVVVYGHSHQSSATTRGGVLYVNPGSAGPRRFRLPVTIALLQLDGAEAEARIVELTS